MEEIAKTAEYVSSVFPNGYRGSGVLLHVTSLPCPHGIGGFGPEAIRWIDLLADAGQTWWQILPIGPPDKGNSPYTPLSTFACNPLLISPECLVIDKLLTEDQCEVTEPFSDDVVDFDRVSVWKEYLLAVAFDTFQQSRAGTHSELDREFTDFCHRERRWLEDFSMFVTLKKKFHEARYVDWPAEYLQRDPVVLNDEAQQHSSQIERIKFYQFLAFRQLGHVRAHAANRGVKLFGDLPIFVSADSSDVWANPKLFLLDDKYQPLFVAGVPPDYFSATGQLWGNPVYDWDVLRQSGYAWWIDRLRSLLGQHDLVRLDHFRGFSAAWHVPAGSPTAETGAWVDGPGSDFFIKVQAALGGLPFVAEDLGTITDDVRALLAEFAFPKMGVLQFAFDGDSTNAFLPHHMTENMVVYTGTHDNDTSLGWYRTLADSHKDSFWKYLDMPVAGSELDVARLMMELAWASIAALAIVPMQDVLGLGGEARMNLPGIADGNWAWRCTDDAMFSADWAGLRQLTEQHRRTAK